MYGAQRSPVADSSAWPAHHTGTSLWMQRSLTSPTQGLFSDDLASSAAPLLLSRSIRETTLHRVEGGLSRMASNYTASGDDNDDTHAAAIPMEMPDLLAKDASISFSAGSSFSSRHITTSHACLASPSSQSPGGSSETTMNFESLWNNIDRYLFAVYTTLQTSDESSLRPLRTPKHRMGWYTVIYNACSGDPAKSRELYARLALLLLHLLESHVLFPVLQSVDQRRVHFLTGAEDRAVEDLASSALRLSGSRGGGGGWGPFRSTSTGSGHARAGRSKTTSRDSSLHGSTGGNHHTNTSNSSFGFMRGLFQSLHHSPSPAVSVHHDDVVEENSMEEEGRLSASHGLPPTLTSASAGQSLRSRAGLSLASSPSTPRRTPLLAGGDGAGALTHRQSSAVSAPNELSSAFDGLGMAVRLHSAPEAPLPAQQPIHSPSSAAATVRKMELATKRSVGPTTRQAYAPMTRSPLAASAQTPLTQPPALSQHSAVCTAPHAAWSITSFRAQPAAAATAPSSGTPSHHARVASKTGRVLVNDEEEVLCEANTVTSNQRRPKRSRRMSLKKNSVIETESSKSANSSTAPPPLHSTDASTHTHISDELDDNSLRTMNSSLSSTHLSHNEDNDKDEELSALTGGSANVAWHDLRRLSCGRRRPPQAPSPVGLSSFPDNEADGPTAVSPALSASPSSASLVTAVDVDSPFLSMELSSATFVGTTEHETTAAASVQAVPGLTQQLPQRTAAASSESVHQLSQVLNKSGDTATGLLSMKRGESDNTPNAPASNTDPISPHTSTIFTSRQASSSRPASWYSERETAAPISRPTTPQALNSPQESPLYDGGGDGGGGGGHCTGDTTALASDHAGSHVYGNRRFSLCYTFIQEWQTFLIFRGVVLSCFRYLDQYYTRRYGMDTITLMCFKVFYVAVYEPLHPLLMLELRFLTRYVREVFEKTGQIAWEQVELIQSTYSIMAELLVLVQSTSSYMVAKQQQKPASGGVGGASAANTSSSVIAAAVTQPTPHASVEMPRSRTNSRSCGLGVGRGGGGADSGASSVVSTPRLGSLDIPCRAPSTSPTTAAASTDRASSHHHHHHESRRRNLLSLFSGRRHGETSASKEGSRSAPLRSSSPGDSAEAASRRLAITNRRSSISCVSLSGDFEGGGGVSGGDGAVRTSLSAADEVLDVEGVDRAQLNSSSPCASPIGSPEAPIVVVDLRGTVELRDRLEGHTTAYHLTTQALKQWEGLAADRRLRNGTIVKETAEPLAAIVMEDMGNEYMAGIYSFYRCASEAHRGTEEGRRNYVKWAVKAKELEMQVWRRVRLPFLHAALRSALNEVLVREQHRSILLDRQFGLRALLDEWSASVKRDDLTLAPQVSGVMSAGVSTTLRSSQQHFISSFPHPTPSSSPRVPLSRAWGKDAATIPHQESSWRWDQAGEASVMTDPAPSCGSRERFGERVSAWVDVGDTSGQMARPSPTHHGPAMDATKEAATAGTVSTTSDLTRRLAGVEKLLGASAASPADRSSQQGPDVQPQMHSAMDHAAPQQPAPSPAVEPLQALYNLFSDVTEDECFVLMSAVLITKFFRDAAALFEDYIKRTTDAAGAAEPGSSSRQTAAVMHPAGSAAAGPSPAHAPVGPAAAVVTNCGVQLMTALVDLIDRYIQLVETVFQSQPILLRAVEDAVGEVMCPTRWTKKGSLQAAQYRAQELLNAAAASASASLNDESATFVTPKSDLPSVLLSRDARHAMLPLASLATHHPQAVQQLKLSVMLARYADTFLQQERAGGRVVSGGIFKRLHLIGQLVSLLEDKDTFLEHYRLCLARRLLNTSGSAAPPATAAATGREQEPTTSPSSYGMLNLEAERQLVICLQSYLGSTGTHAFEAMLRDYEGTLRTRDLFEQEPAFAELSAKIRVQLITSAQWPMYTMLPLTPHVSLQKGIDAFRDYYAKAHPSRTLLWVFSLGTATLTAKMPSGAEKQISASTLLATLLLVVSDAYNACADQAGSITGAHIAQKVGIPFHALRMHLHLLSQHRAFNLLRWTPVGAGATKTLGNTSAAEMTENDTFTLNPAYTHKLRKIRLPLPKMRLTGLPSNEATADRAMSLIAEGTPWESEDAVVNRHVFASRRLLLDAALVRVFKSRRVLLFEDLFQAVTAQLSRQFVPTRRDIKAQLEGLIDRDYVRRSAEDPNAFVYVS
ncbi:hypothetical protein ABL78_5384 [Leptomonas seymouri]|uniref:Cullin family profile domain-containing protein n=1 Tax=Leptomonas seymouri TaxID=5684 RepID=A0A0N1IJW2_LEPSE|nr:hypothetical protein ABL78_5384 [Leptomonas seymouri]|eukprot:KPI85555.1 hypothetical protein ABL78_5384 [Leptomonas seymouri]